MSTDLSLEALRDRVDALTAARPALGHTVQLKVDGEGAILLDGRTAPMKVTLEDAPAELTVSLSADTLAGLLDGSVDGAEAFAAGRLKVAGDFGVVFALGELFAA